MLHYQETTAPCFHLLVCGTDDHWAAQTEVLASLSLRYTGVLSLHRLARSPAPGVLGDPTGVALQRLGVHDAALYLVRPDGYIAYRCAGRKLHGLEQYLGSLFLHRRRTAAT